MSAPETLDELRARLDTLAVAACRPPRTHPPTEEEQRAWEEFATAVLDAWPAIDALLARLTAAEDELLTERQRGDLNAARADTEQERNDTLAARLTAAEAERDEALIAINGGCGCPAPFDTCPHDEPLLPALNDARARIAELTAPLEPNDSLLERAKEVVKVGGLYGLGDGTVDLIAELAARCEQLTALRGCSQ